MPIPSPNKGENKDSFLKRCMGDSAMNEEFPNQSQRYAVCLSTWKKALAGKIKQILIHMKDNNK